MNNNCFYSFLPQFKLTSMLEADLSQTSRDYSSPDPKQAFGIQAKNEKKPRFITYPVFLDAYWPHFNQKLTKGLGKHSLNLIFL